MGRRILDEIVVVDVEATCWERGKEPKGFVNDIIEVGVCLLNIDTLKISKQDGIIVTPTSSTISEFCTTLTTLTPEFVKDKGIPFSEACDILIKSYSSSTRTWASWGDYDMNQFQRQCRRENVMYPFDVRHINVKNMFSALSGMGKEVGLGTAVDMMGLKFDGTQHRGVDDATNIARVFSEMIKKYRLNK